MKVVILLKSLFVLLFILMFSVSLFAFSITKNTNVVIKENATEAEKYAAEEFIKYIEKITGNKLNITTTETPKSVYISALGDETGDDGVNINFKDNNLYIQGNSPRGTIYSVYEFLVKYLGVEFYTKDIEKIPSKKAIVLSNNINYSYTPSFMSREAYYRGNNAYPEFALKHKLNGNHNYISEEMGGHIELINWCHSSMVYLPPEKYMNEHPEFYSLVTGRRVPIQLCWTNKEMQKELAKRVIEILDSYNNPKIIDVSQMDNTTECECENCRAAKEKYASPAGALVEMINYVAGEVKKKYPNVYVETLAYQHTLPAPKGITCADNVIIRVCDIENNFCEPIAEKSAFGPYTPVNGRNWGYIDTQTINKVFADNLEAWANICKSLYVWDYTVNFSNCHIVHPNLHILKPNLQYFRDHNVIAMFEQGDYYNEGSTFNELKNFLISKLLWNPDEDVDKLKEDFCKNVYGKGYKEILKIIDIYTNAVYHKGLYYPTYVYDMEWMTEDDYVKSVKLFQEALKKTEKDEQANTKINNIYISFLYGWYVMNDEKFDRVLMECKLPWNDKEEFSEYFEKYIIAHGNGYISEGKPIDFVAAAYELKKSDKTPQFIIDNNIKDEDWFEIDSLDFGLHAIGVQREEKDASFGTVTDLYPTQTEWSMQRSVSGNIVNFKKAGKTSLDVYVECKTVNKHNDIGDIATLGVWDYNTNSNRFKNNIAAKDLNDNSFNIIYLGNFEFGDCKDGTFYMCGVNNPDCAEAITIDRVICVLK
ncbi:MAG: DUF4838 domain-containing protein [Abditibacteriota bacterium]|nr:DUF4838 domain-containing protein [Abditibacteriota bacterium]